MAGSEYYNHTTYPSTGAAGASAAMRAELDLVEAGFGKLPDLSGNGGKIVAVNAGATALEAITSTGTGSAVRATSPTLVTPTLGVATATSINKVAITAPASGATLTLADGATLATVGAFATTLTATGATGLTLPTTGTLATLAGSETLTNKTISKASNTLTGVAASGANSDITSLGALASINSGPISGHRNKIIGYFDINQRALTSVGDDAYCADGWYVLTESGNVGVAQVVDPEAGAPFGWRIAQPDVSAKRIGLATIIESKNIRQYRSTAMHLAMRVKPSFAGNVRYAILEHTGTADSVTSDVVSNWSSTTYTPSNFFIAGVTVLKTGTIAPGAGIYDWIDDWTVLGASCNNVILFFWSESALAQNEEIAFNRPQFEPGTVRTLHEWRHNELELCQRYCRTLKYVGGRQYVVSNAPTWYFNFPTMFTTPTITGTYIGDGSTPTITGISADTGRITSATVGTIEALLYQDVLLVAPL